MILRTAVCLAGEPQKCQKVRLPLTLVFALYGTLPLDVTPEGPDVPDVDGCTVPATGEVADVLVVGVPLEDP